MAQADCFSLAPCPNRACCVSERTVLQLEGAGLFDFGIPRASFRRSPLLLLFYSHRIGLAEGHAVPIIAGGKITGKVGPYRSAERADGRISHQSRHYRGRRHR